MEGTLYQALIFGVGLLAGFINTVAAGGSMLVLPVLILSGLPSDLANGTNRVAILFQNIVAVGGFKRHGHWMPRRSLILGFAALTGAVPGAFLAIELSDEWFQRILGGVILLAGGYILLQERIRARAEASSLSSNKVWSVVPVFFLIGVYGGFVQAGVGFLLLAALTGILGLGLANANAVKVFVVLIYTIAALAVFFWTGHVDWVKGGVLAAGNMLGAIGGSRWASTVNPSYVRYFIAILAFFLALRLWI